ncbi:hypothetical protein [Polyangium aurulentum]|uniref:hypothetical protein n=1 Tax=Polyangium aurulentum TaxID=2567896 RepID=UPI0010AE377F|nr:hypothetical protein [Polyangium aurulentum]UQA58780.1 hypothetical protein E8A73_047415 [Polyangium aurulentum]
MTTTLRSVSALFSLVTLSAFGFGCSAQVGEEIGTSEAAIGRAQPTPVIETGCPEGEHEETICEDSARGSLEKKSPKKNIIAAPPCETICVPDPEPPTSSCPEGQHEETVCEDGARDTLGKKKPKKNIIAAPPCETICVDDEPPPSDCPDGNVVEVCEPSVRGGSSNIIAAPPECWDECIPSAR